MTGEKDRINEGKEFRQRMMDKLEIEYSAVETIKPEDDKEKYIWAMEERLAKLKAMTDEIKEKSKNMSNETRAQFEKERERLLGLHAEARSKLNDVLQSGSETWKKLHDNSISAWREFADGVKKAVDKFR